MSVDFEATITELKRLQAELSAIQSRLRSADECVADAETKFDCFLRGELAMHPSALETLCEKSRQARLTRETLEADLKLKQEEFAEKKRTLLEEPSSLFRTDKELLSFAGDYLHEKVASLQRDVNRCVEGQTHLPALLECFATINFLGALLAGNARSDAPTVRQSADYMRRFMGYPDARIVFVRDHFRYKLFQLAQPTPVVRHADGFMAWECQLPGDESKHEHMSVSRLQKPLSLEITPSRRIECNYVFAVNIERFDREIRSSVIEENGYLSALSRDSSLRRKFETALSQMY